MVFSIATTKVKNNYDMGERALPLFRQFMTFYDTIRYFETLQVPENEQSLCLIVFCCATSHSYQAHKRSILLKFNKILDFFIPSM